MDLKSKKGSQSWRYYSLSEIITDLITTRLTPAERKEIEQTKRVELWRLYNSMDDYILHTYRLGEEGNPLVKDGIKPHDICYEIVKQVWCKLTGEPYTEEAPTPAPKPEQKDDDDDDYPYAGWYKHMD